MWNFDKQEQEKEGKMNSGWGHQLGKIHDGVKALVKCCPSEDSEICTCMLFV